jgi:hypothetical protein
MTGVVGAENKDLRSRLSNWKFESAMNYLDGESEEVAVKTLDGLFGNCGWFWGNMGEVVGLAVLYLIGHDEPESGSA